MSNKFRLCAALLLGCCAASAQEKKPAPKAAPAPHTAAPAPHTGAPAARPGGGTPAAPHGPTTAGSHGPTTAGSRGPTSTTSHVTPAAGGGTQRPGAPAIGAHPGTRMADRRSVPTGSRVVTGRGGNEVRMRPNGRPGDVHIAGRGMDIHHGLAGGRRVEVVRADHSRVVVERGGRGYVQRPYQYGGREYGHRTYYYGGRPYDRFYARYPYRGVYLDVYSPAYYYQPAFYGWAYNPWVAPISYSWGWGGNPWYGYYGYYFNPYPVYPSASYWLTDYMISQTLAASYQARMEAAAADQAAAAYGGPPQGAVAMTPDVKNMISAEVQRQIALENSEAQAASAADPASSSLQRMLSDGVQHVFVAGTAIDVTDATGAECALTEGDALQLAGSAAPDATSVNTVVLASKGGQECRTGSTVLVTLNDLQNMQNHMRETIDQGMGELQTKQAKGGLPPLPPSANAPPVKAPFAAEAPPPDQSGANEIAQQSQQADQAEKEVLNQVPEAGAPATSVASAGMAPIPAPAGPTPTLTLGQSVDEVTAIEGAPTRIVDLGAKKIYLFRDGIKVTFKDSKAAEIQ